MVTVESDGGGNRSPADSTLTQTGCKKRQPDVLAVSSRQWVPGPFHDAETGIQQLARSGLLICRRSLEVYRTPPESTVFDINVEIPSRTARGCPLVFHGRCTDARHDAGRSVDANLNIAVLDRSHP